MHQFKHRRMSEVDNLWVVAVITNTPRYKSRYELFDRFRSGVKTAGANLLVVEAALGDRPHEVTQGEYAEHCNWSVIGPDEIHVRLRTSNEIWHKENLINLGVQRLPQNWKYVAWIDADVEFCRQDWVAETVHQLQHYHVIQMFQTCADLGPTGEVLQVQKGFVHSWLEGRQLPSGYYGGFGDFHPGYAWAARREAFNDLGGLFDVAILGSADHHMAWALVGMADRYLTPHLSPGYRRRLEVWQRRADIHVKQNIGFMPGSIYHNFHGKKRDRRYNNRWDILLKHNYDPDLDLKRDWQGLYQLSDEGLRLRSDLRRYFHARNEDSIDL